MAFKIKNPYPKPSGPLSLNPSLVAGAQQSAPGTASTAAMESFSGAIDEETAQTKCVADGGTWNEQTGKCDMPEEEEGKGDVSKEDLGKLAMGIPPVG